MLNDGFMITKVVDHVNSGAWINIQAWDGSLRFECSDIVYNANEHVLYLYDNKVNAGSIDLKQTEVNYNVLDIYEEEKINHIDVGYGEFKNAGKGEVLTDDDILREEVDE